MQTLWHDVRYGFWMLVKTPGVTAAAVLMLGLGTGASTALFTTIKAVLLNSLPYKQAEQLVTLATNEKEVPNPVNVSYGLVQDWKERSKSFQSIAMYRGWQPTLTGQGKPEVLRAERVSYDFFQTLGIDPVVLLSYGFRVRPSRRADV